MPGRLSAVNDPIKVVGYTTTWNEISKTPLPVVNACQRLGFAIACSKLNQWHFDRVPALPFPTDQ